MKLNKRKRTKKKKDGKRIEKRDCDYIQIQYTVDNMKKKPESKSNTNMNGIIKQLKLVVLTLKRHVQIHLKSERRRRFKVTR